MGLLFKNKIKMKTQDLLKALTIVKTRIREAKN